MVDNEWNISTWQSWRMDRVRWGIISFEFGTRSSIFWCSRVNQFYSYLPETITTGINERPTKLIEGFMAWRLRWRQPKQCGPNQFVWLGSATRSLHNQFLGAPRTLLVFSIYPNALVGRKRELVYHRVPNFRMILLRNAGGDSRGDGSYRGPRHAFHEYRGCRAVLSAAQTYICYLI